MSADVDVESADAAGLLLFPHAAKSIADAAMANKLIFFITYFFLITRLIIRTQSYVFNRYFVIFFYII